MLKDNKTIAAEIKASSDNQSEQIKRMGLVQSLVFEFKDFVGNITAGLYKKLAGTKFDVEVKNQIVLPEVQKISGEVSLSDTKALLIGLNEIVRGIESAKKSHEQMSKGMEKSLAPKEMDMSCLEEAINAIEIPEPLKEVSVSNLKDYSDKLDAIKKEISKLKLDPKIEVQPTKVTIDLDGLKNQLQAILDALVTPEKDDEPTGFSWTKNSEGNLSTFTEIYPDGKVVSTGWDINKVEINDQRN